MKREMSTVVKLATTALLVSNVSIAHASYSNVELGSYYAPNRITPGMTANLSASVCAQRNSNVTIPVSFYFSPSANITGASTYLGSASASLAAQGSYCSSIVNKSVTLPTQTLSNCFNPFNGYFIFKAGSDVKATPYGVIGSDVMPTVESFSPASGHPGSVVHIKGDNFNEDTTAVFIGGVQAARGFEKDQNDNITGIFAIVPDGATSDKIRVSQYSNGYPLCGGSESQSTYDFVVDAAPAYCASNALYNGYSKIDYVSSKNFINDFRSDSACGGYGDNTSAITLTSQGTASEEVKVQFGTCGAPDYSKLFKVYVDWNNDKDFDDPGEFVVNAPNVAADTLYAMGLSVPATATLGTTRMRLITALYYTGTVDSTSDVPACGSYPFGQTLDYALDIVASNGVLTATNKALNLEFNSTGSTADETIQLINNPKRQQIKIKRNFIDKALPDLPPVVFSYPKGYSKP